MQARTHQHRVAEVGRRRGRPKLAEAAPQVGSVGGRSRRLGGRAGAALAPGGRSKGLEEVVDEARLAAGGLAHLAEGGEPGAGEAQVRSAPAVATLRPAHRHARQRAMRKLQHPSRAHHEQVEAVGAPRQLDVQQRAARRRQQRGRGRGRQGVEVWRQPASTLGLGHQAVGGLVCRRHAGCGGRGGGVDAVARAAVGGAGPGAPGAGEAGQGALD